MLFPPFKEYLSRRKLTAYSFGVQATLPTADCLGEKVTMDEYKITTGEEMSWLVKECRDYTASYKLI